MNKALKYIVGGFLCLATLTCLVLALINAKRQQEQQVFTRIAVENDSPQGRSFLEDE